MAQLSKVVRSLPRLAFLLNQNNVCNRSLSASTSGAGTSKQSQSPSMVKELTRTLSTQPPSRTKKGEKRRYDDDSDSDSDSDSNGETSRKRVSSDRGDSEFWRRKMRTLHGILDLNKDGVISFDDFLLLTDRFTKLAHMTQQHHEEFKALMMNVWEAQYGPIDPYNLITTEQFLEELHHALNDRYLRKKMHLFLPYLFKAVDKEKNGEITVEEYKLFFKCLGLKDEDAVLSFRAIDENDDGRITLKEFQHLGKEFFHSEDEKKPSKWFWGPLVEH